MRPLSPISPPSPEPPPMFDERRPREHRAWALPFFLLIALLVHSLGFYTFHVVYPTPRDVPTATATLNLVTINEPGQGSPDGSQPLLAGWLRDSDPALLTTWRAHPPDWSRLLRGNYAPLFDRWRLEPELAPLTTPFTDKALKLAAAVPTESWDWRLGQTPMDMDPAWLGIQPAPDDETADMTNPHSPPTRIRLSPLAASDEPSTTPPFQAPAPGQLNLPPFQAGGESLGTVQNAEYLLGADTKGQILFTLTRRGSNSAELDAAADRYLHALKLPNPDDSAASGITWWRACFAWGKEVFTRP